MLVRSMNQGKLKVVKQEMARVNVDILGISELKWTGMGEFNSDDHISTTVGRNLLEEKADTFGQCVARVSTDFSKVLPACSPVVTFWSLQAAVC